MISQKEYAKRRAKLAKKLPDNSVSILYSARYKTRSNDTEYPFRQDSDFYYLSGFKEDKSALSFVKQNGKTEITLFVAKKDKTQELWNGKRLGVARAKEIFMVDEVFEYENLHIKDGKNSEDILKLIREMRLKKSKSEISLIKKAINITKEAHHHAIKYNKSSKYEYELQAEIEHIFKKRGAYSDAYTSIVACGDSANTLHYISNDKPLLKDKLILIDAGCEYDYYASDITRTIPVNRKFSEPQKELYNMVLDVQLKIIEMIKPNILRTKLQKESEKLLCEGLVELGILKGSVKKLLKKKKHKKYYPHGIGHWMGLDVHDNAPYKDKNGKEIPLKNGMVLTIEPGIYCSEDDKNIQKKYRGIGIRIEDDILVTKDGYENLSLSIAKSVEEIENL